MPRVNVWLPDELFDTLQHRLPGLNVSRTLQDALRALLGCRHETLVCQACAVEVDHVELIGAWLHKFYVDYLGRLEPLVARAGTAEGAVRVLRDLADSWHAAGVMSHDYRRHPMPRPARPARAAAATDALPPPPPTGVKDWALHPAARSRAAAQRNRARARARRRNEESA